MDKTKLKEELEQAGIDPQAYSLHGGLPNEQYVLNQQRDGRWEIYYSERGQKSGLRSFDSEGAACEFFLNYVLKGTTVRGK